MNKASLLLSITLIFVFIFSGCSIEKRRYTHGYNIQWNSAKPDMRKEQAAGSRKQNEEGKNSSSTQAPPVSMNNDEPVTASADNSKAIAYAANKKNHRKADIAPDDCDVITLKNGEEIRAKVTYVLESEIKYKKCGEQNGDTHTVKKSDVFMIKYANGTKDVFNGDSKDAAKNKAEEKTDSGIFGILSFVFIVLGVVLASPTAGISLIIFIPAAIVFGAIGLGPDRTNRGFAMAGLILGIITVFFFLVALIAYADGL